MKKLTKHSLLLIQHKHIHRLALRRSWRHFYFHHFFILYKLIYLFLKLPNVDVGKNLDFHGRSFLPYSLVYPSPSTRWISLAFFSPIFSTVCSSGILAFIIFFMLPKRSSSGLLNFGPMPGNAAMIYSC